MFPNFLVAGFCRLASLTSSATPALATGSAARAIEAGKSKQFHQDRLDGLVDGVEEGRGAAVRRCPHPPGCCCRSFCCK